LITIEKVDNGFIMKFDSYDLDTDQTGQYTKVFENKESEVEALIDLFYEVLEQIGWINQKYERENIVIRKIHGKNYECNDKKCQICNDEFE